MSCQSLRVPARMRSSSAHACNSNANHKEQIRLIAASIRGMDLSTWVESAEATSWNNVNGNNCDKNDNILKASMRSTGICRDSDGRALVERSHSPRGTLESKTW